MSAQSTLQWALPWDQPRLGFAGERGGEWAGDVGELGGSWTGMEITGDRRPPAYNSHCVTTQVEDSDQGICGAEPGLVEGIKDMQVQERRSWSVPLVAWTDQEGGPGPSSPLSHWPFPALAAHPRAMGESFCETVSILLLVSVPGWGQ